MDFANKEIEFGNQNMMLQIKSLGLIASKYATLFEYTET
jgi:hypothetical protein